MFFHVVLGCCVVAVVEPVYAVIYDSVEMKLLLCVGALLQGCTFSLNSVCMGFYTVVQCDGLDA